MITVMQSRWHSWLRQHVHINIVGLDKSPNPTHLGCLLTLQTMWQTVMLTDILDSNLNDCSLVKYISLTVLMEWGLNSDVPPIPIQRTIMKWGLNSDVPPISIQRTIMKWGLNSDVPPISIQRTIMKWCLNSDVPPVLIQQTITSHLYSFDHRKDIDIYDVEIQSWFVTGATIWRG
jgi:hypothetical protein